MLPRSSTQGPSISHWALIREAVREAEKRQGRYLTAPEVHEIAHGSTSDKLSALELRAMKRIWPGMQLEFNLERHRG